MKVQILGTGCPKCKKLAANAEEAIEASGIDDAQIEKIDKLPEIMKFGVMSTPALAIDGDVKSAGKILSAEQIQTMLEGE
ncbi:MAG: thioredoxin family protein [Armatimonadota bacterium]